MSGEDLCTLAEMYGVDKCPAINHTYTPAYDKLLSQFRDSVKLFLEIGIGNVPLMKPIVGEAYRPGASLRMWRDYFQNSQIVGCDILESVLFQDERIQTFYVDQSSESSLTTFALNNLKRLGDYADIILDDGSHIDSHQKLTFRTLWRHVRPNGGIYIIEDIPRARLEEFSKLNMVYGFSDAKLIYVHDNENDREGFVAFQKVEPEPTNLLVYMCVFYNRFYLQMMKLLLTTIRINTDYTKYSFLVMTTEDFRDDVVAVGNSVGVRLQIHIIDPPTVFLESESKRNLFGIPNFEPYAFHSSASKCRIFEVPGVEIYSHILYLDTDILIRKDFKDMLTFLPASDSLYAIEDGRLDHPGNGGTFFTPETCRNPHETPAINAGVFLFRNTPKIREIMTDCVKFMNDRIEREEKMPCCLEQPFVNFFFYKNDSLDSQFMKHYISLGESGAMSPLKNISIIHFFAPIGDGYGKFKRMNAFVSTMVEDVENKRNITQSESISGKVFEWTDSNYHISFQDDGTLKTTWFYGRYYWIEKRTMIADFGNVRHLIHFDCDFNTFVSLRKTDGEIVCGRLSSQIEKN